MCARSRPCVLQLLHPPKLPPDFLGLGELVQRLGPIYPRTVGVFLMNIIRRAAVGVALLGGLLASAQAALPEGVATAIAAAQTDGLTAVGLLAAMGAAVFLIVMVLKKLRIMP